MRPIKIDKDLNDFAIQFSNDLFADRPINFVAPSILLANLLAKYSALGLMNHVRVLKLIIFSYNKSLLYCNPEIQQKLVNYTDSKLGSIFFNGKSATTFSEEIIKALRYDSLQKHYAYKIADKLELKTCPYCNAMLAITIRKGKKKKARFQLDHFFPKSKYPFLCTSYFNLIPCCGNCNQGKSNNSVSLGVDFHLYSDKTPLNAFKFKLEDIDVVKKTIGIKEDKIIIKINHNTIADEAFVEKHNKDYAIQSIYDTQKDIVEELVWKTQWYNSYKIEEIENMLKITPTEIKRMLLGNYVEYENIHKRPLSKFMQDIAADLDFF